MPVFRSRLDDLQLLLRTLQELSRRKRLCRKLFALLLRPLRARRQQAALQATNAVHLSPAWLIQREERYSGGKIRKVPRVVASNEPDLAWAFDFGSDKMAATANGCAPAYSKILASWTHSRLVVEIGILDGSGLALWSNVFPRANLVGLDLRRDLFDENYENLQALGAFQNSAPNVLEIDAYRPDAARLAAFFGSLDFIDVVIDDGPHTLAAIESMLRALRPYLANSFLYVVEDNPGSRPLLDNIFSGTARVRSIGGLVVAERTA